MKKRNVAETVCRCGRAALGRRAMSRAGRAVAGGIGIALACVASVFAQDPVITKFSVAHPPTGSVTNRGYYVQAASATETRVYGDGHHYLSVLTEGGIFALRPHPGDDVDGWGSTLYLQPFIAGATLKHTTNVLVAVVTNGTGGRVRIFAQGAVSRGLSDTYGTWAATLDVTFAAKTMTATGRYAVLLSGLTSGVGDLNFYKLASNFLKDVPVVSGAVTNTGDMQYVIYDGSSFPGDWSRPLIWDPAINAGHFPSDEQTWLSVDLLGGTNEVDTARQGYQPIMPAHKPGLRVVLRSLNSATIRFGAYYNLSQSQWFWADNIGITPWAPAAASATSYDFALDIESVALPGDHYSDEVALTATGLARPYYGVWFTPSLAFAFSRIGSLVAGSGVLTGKVKTGLPGFLQVRREN